MVLEVNLRISGVRVTLDRVGPVEGTKNPPALGGGRKESTVSPLLRNSRADEVAWVSL
jgi:hypothetical protein